jgi:transcriptional regulator with XRE-family HTH domain
MISYCYSLVKWVKCAYTEPPRTKEELPLPNILGDKIRKLRKKKDYTLDKLAELAESSKSYIWELENKNPPRPSADKLSKIAQVLETTVEFLLDDETEEVAEEEAADVRFYRDYRKMDAVTKEKIRRMARMLGEE